MFNYITDPISGSSSDFLASSFSVSCLSFSIALVDPFCLEKLVFVYIHLAFLSVLIIVGGRLCGLENLRLTVPYALIFIGW